MAWTTEYAFGEFYDAINLPGDHREAANLRRDWVIARLRSGGMNVLEAVTMGSIPRFTALKDRADADVMAVLHYGQHIKGETPAQVLLDVKNAMNLGTAGSIRRNGQAVTVSFTSWPNVDVVPASRIVNDGIVTGFEIPDMNRGVWLSTNPPQHARDIAADVTARGPNFRRVIKMIKDWNRRQTIRLQSYHIEVIALEMSATWDDYSYPIFKWFQAAQPACSWLWHANSDVSGYLSYDQAHKAKAQLATAERIASSAWLTAGRGDHREAIRLYKTVFGQRFPSYG